MFLAPAPVAAAAAPRPQGAFDAADGQAYLERQGAHALQLWREGDRAGALDGVDRVLSLVASLSNPEAAPQATALAVSHMTFLLLEAGEVDRAFGLYRAAGTHVARLLPAGLETGLWRLAEARLLQLRGDRAGAETAAAAALESLGPDGPGAVARQLQALLAAERSDLDSARSVLAADPRAAVLVQPPGPERQAALRRIAREIRDSALAPGAARRWNRPGPLDRLLVMAALAEIADLDPETGFVLAQLAGRTGASFDADALTVLAQASDELQRRTIHQALRLRARRDRLERIEVQRVLAAATAGTASKASAGERLRHAPERRLRLRDFNRRLADAEASLARDGLALTPAPVVGLARFQATLAPGEAALAAVPLPGGLAHVCVRRNATAAAFVAADPARLRLDTRLVQNALTAGHAASEALDIQFPVEAAVRLHAALVGPAEGCLKAGDRILWLAGAAGAQVPLAALLRAPPPRLENGWDLAKADWLIRRHAVAYAGQPGVVVAARTGPRVAAADFDFLGVGDPLLGGDTAAVLRGSRLSALAPLPETRDELIASAKGFHAPRLLMGAEATERALRGEMTGAYRHLSFATHGLIREDLQGLSEPALVLTPVASDDPMDDGLFTASEIADLNLRAAFVALSACNTANFDLNEMARDLPALASAFAVAGAPATLGTLWPVDSGTGQRVVTGVFARLKTPGASPADALAEAQRAFLDAAPDRARLHPRFWAPFLVLGDGGAPMPPAGTGLTLAEAEVLTRRGGEVLALDRTEDALAARLISDADAAGRQGAAVRLARGGAEAWRAEDHDQGASRVLARFGQTLAVGGYALGPHGRYAPTVDLLDAAGGRTLSRWRGDDLARVDAFPLAAARTGEALLLAVGELNLRDPPGAGGGRLHLLAFQGEGPPRRLATLEAPGRRLSSATVTVLGDRLLVTWSDDQAPRAADPAWTDDYDAPACAWGRLTRAVLLDAASGAVLAEADLPHTAVIAAAPAARGSVFLAGSRREACGEARATVVALDTALAPRTLWTDPSLGASEVRAMAPLSDGRLLLAASKANVVDYLPVDLARARAADPYAVLPFDDTVSGLLLTLDARGRPGPPKLLDAASNVYVTALEAGRPGEVLLGGAVGGQAAIFRLVEGR